MGNIREKHSKNQSNGEADKDPASEADAKARFFGNDRIRDVCHDAFCHLDMIFQDGLKGKSTHVELASGRSGSQ